MYEGEYSAVIGSKEPVAGKLILGTQKNAFFDQSQRAAFAPVQQTTEFRQTKL
jgi:hypothetical protein